MAYQEATVYSTGGPKWAEISRPTKIGIIVLSSPVILGAAFIMAPFLLIGYGLGILADEQIKSTSTKSNH